MAERPFKVLFEGKPGVVVPSPWQSWDQCAIDIHRKVPLDAYAIVQSPSGAGFLIFKPQSTGAAARNCHGHTNRFIPSFAELASNYSGIVGIPICGSNPQKIILDTTTTLVADKLPQEPVSLSKALDKAAPRAGDILVWVDRITGTIDHSTTVVGRVDGDWLVDDKMNDRPERKTWVTVVANALYRPPYVDPRGDEGEYHPEREGSNYDVQLRRVK